MRNKLLLFGFLIVYLTSCSKGEGTWEEFTDPIFITLLNKKHNIPITEKGRINMDDDATLKALEEITALELKETRVTNLSGINNLVSLRYLTCNNNRLTSLNVSRLQHLKYLICNGNSIKTLNIKECTQLEDLECQNNLITSLNIEGSAKLFSLHCSHNRLKKLDIRGCNKLTSMTCGRQMDNKENPVMLTLVIQKELQQYWEKHWKESYSNQNVTTNYKE